MIIDLGNWNEYLADDVAPGAFPYGVQLETMQILTSEAFREHSRDDVPTGLTTDPKGIKVRFFWRLKK